MLNKKEIPCQIINTKHQILLMCNTQSIPDNQDKSLIKQFIREVEVPDKYFNHIKKKELLSLAIEYCRVTAKYVIFTMENSQAWIQSSETCQLTYVLKWVIEKENLKRNLHLLPEINENNPLRTMIILNIAYEIEHQYTVQQLLQILTDNSEIFYLITQFFLRIIDACTFAERQQFLVSLQEEICNSAQNQLCFFKLLLQMYCSYSNELVNIFPNFSADSLNNLIKWEDYKAFLIEQQRFPILYERKSKIVYGWTPQNQDEEFKQFKKTFAQETKSLKNLLTSEKTKVKPYFLLELYNDNLTQSQKTQETQTPPQLPMTNQNTKKESYQGYFTWSQNINKPQPQARPRPPPPPPPPLFYPRIYQKEFPIMNLQIFNGSIANIVWSEIKVVPIKEEILSRLKVIVRENKLNFFQKQDKQQKAQVKSFLGAKEQLVELIRAYFYHNKIYNIQEILTQIENFQLKEFEAQEEEGEQNQVLKVNSLSFKIIQSLMSLLKDINLNWTEIKNILEEYHNNQRKTNFDLPKNEFNENEKFVIRLFQKNTQKAIEIYNFWFNHLEDSQLIESRVTQFREVLKSLKFDRQLIYYFSFLIQYAKKLSSDPSFSNMDIKQLLALSFKTQGGTSEDLSSIIVSEMRQIGIVFTKNELLQLKNFSHYDNPMSQVEYHIEQYSAQIRLLESLKESNQEIKQKQVIERILRQYNQFKKMIEGIYNNNIELYHELRVFYGDDLQPKQIHKFFQEILSLKKELLIYNQKIEEREAVQRRQQLKKLREKGKIKN